MSGILAKALMDFNDNMLLYLYLSTKCFVFSLKENTVHILLTELINLSI